MREGDFFLTNFFLPKITHFIVIPYIRVFFFHKRGLFHIDLGFFFVFFLLLLLTYYDMFYLRLITRCNSIVDN